MTANELRIGNYIKLMLNHEDYETLQVTSDELVMVDKKQADYEPLRLTEEWLLKFEFYKVKNSSSRYSYRDGNWLFNNFWIDKNFEPCVENYGDDCMDVIGVKLDYVHQLQNLYFALTGEELNISWN